MPQRVKHLSDMEIDEISLVDRPANAHARVVIMKSDDAEQDLDEAIFDEDGDEIDPDLLEEGDVVFDSEGDAFLVFDGETELEEVGKSDELMEAVEEIEDFFGKEIEDVSDEEFASLLDDDEVVEKFVGGIDEALKAAKGYAKTQRAGFGAGMAAGGLAGAAAAKFAPKLFGGAKKASNAGKVASHIGRHKLAYGAGGAGAALGGGYLMSKSDEGIAKSFSEELREELSKSLTDMDRDEAISKAMEQVDYMSSALEEAEEIAKSERDLRLVREYEEVAKSYALPVDHEELAPVLMAIAEYLPYEYGEVIHKALTAAGEAIFDEVGFEGGAANNDVLYAVDEFIDQNVSKADISKAAAVEAVFADNPDAYDEYMATRYL